MANAENRTFNLPAEALAALSRLVEPATKDALDAIAEDIATCENLYRAIMDRGGQLSEDEAVFAKAFLEEVISLEGEHAGDAACTLGALHYSGSITPDGEPDYERAFELYSTGAALGNTQALVNLLPPIRPIGPRLAKGRLRVLPARRVHNQHARGHLQVG